MRLFTILCLLPLAAGCHSVAFEDSVDDDFDFHLLVLPLASRADSIHDPYVTGAKVDLWAIDNHSDQDTSGWTMTSDNPSVFAIGKRADDGKGQIAMDDCAAGAPGTANVIIRDKDGNELRRRTITVMAPDRAALLSHGPMLIGADAATDEAKVLLGGTATFQVRWYAGDTELRGNGALAVDAPAGVMATTPQTFLFEERDWLQVTPTAIGAPAALHVHAGTTDVRTFTVDPTDASQVASIRIRGQDESKATKGEWLVALAEGLDTAGTTLLGIEYQWDLDGAPQGGLGDLYRYEFNPAVPKMLTALYNGNRASAAIHWGGGYVDSTNNVGCGLGRGRPPSLAPLALFGAAALVHARRRRRHER